MVPIFSGITAYDNQRIRQVYAQTGDQAGTGMAVFFALQLYLDFINLFLAFLRIFGKTTNMNAKSQSAQQIGSLTNSEIQQFIGYVGFSKSVFIVSFSRLS